MSKRELKALLADSHSSYCVGELATSNRRTRSNTMESPVAESTEELRQRVENLECHLLEARALVDSKVAELREVRQERNDLEDAVAGAERKLSEK